MWRSEDNFWELVLPFYLKEAAFILILQFYSRLAAPQALAIEWLLCLLPSCLRSAGARHDTRALPGAFCVGAEDHTVILHCLASALTHSHLPGPSNS